MKGEEIKRDLPPKRAQPISFLSLPIARILSTFLLPSLFFSGEYEQPRVLRPALAGAALRVRGRLERRWRVLSV